MPRFKLISTGGTASALEQAGHEVTHVEQLTSFPEMVSHMLSAIPFLSMPFQLIQVPMLVRPAIAATHWITNFSQLGFYPFRMFVMRAFSRDSQLVHCIGFPS
jgi:branched-subunit amino acid ABC-type transport system permease component